MDDNGLTQTQIGAVLTSQKTIRVGFFANGNVFVVPMGYAWFDDSLHGITSPGRKLEMAKVSPKVAFQIDTSAQTGNWSWHSVAGDGLFEIIKLPKAALLMPKIVANFTDIPAWFKASQAAEMAKGNLVVWCIRPTTMTGRRLGPVTAGGS